MSTFITSLVYTKVSESLYEIDESFEYHIGSYPNELKVFVPVAFRTDLTSIPKILRRWLPVDGVYAKAAVLHDYCYTFSIGNKSLADSIFLDALTTLKLPYLLRYSFYFGVVLVGRGNYSK